ncbi:MAG TPA: hypothetical protein VF403_23980 [Kofleriaceae bacterium]
MRTIWCGVVLVALAACDAGAPNCKDAVAKAVNNNTQVSRDEQAILTQVCEAKKWSGDVRGCLSRATSKSAATTCLKPVMVDLEAATAEAAARQASADAKAAVDQLEALQTELDASVKEIDAAVTAVLNATSDAERSKATATLSAAHAKRANLEAKLVAATARVNAAQRAKAVHVSQECLDNPLAPGC